jgi:hypothetical protein
MAKRLPFCFPIERCAERLVENTRCRRVDEGSRRNRFYSCLQDVEICPDISLSDCLNPSDLKIQKRDGIDYRHPQSDLQTNVRSTCEFEVA